MYRVKITKVSTNKNAMRTTDMEGKCIHLPQEGESFTVLGIGLEFGFRNFTTSIVKSVVQNDDSYLIETLNSVYKVDVLEEINL